MSAEWQASTGVATITTTNTDDSNALYLDATGSTYYWNYPYVNYPYYSESVTIQKLREEVTELKDKLEMLEEKTGYEIVEEPRYKVRKKRK